MTIKVELQKIGILGLQLIWIFLHFIVSSFYFVVSIATTLESYLISCGFLRKYNHLDINRVQYLAIVVESDEAYNTLKIIELLQWLESMGIRSVCLYDAEGVLKQSKEIILKKVKNASVFQTNEPLQLNCKGFTLEFISASDGKEAVARAASFLLKDKWRKTNMSGDSNQCFSESQMTEALKAVGCGGPDPDLILVYGPSRCHLGFPAWRIRYTEILHMGPLKSKKYGSLVKAIYKFTMVRQNYGELLAIALISSSEIM
ncbi:dehydrodolichyl diphosphate synthase complex subunit nus1-like isoform X2 [Cucurbita maxima]|uniref:ditrans,polycis-polyprenyl diphosphate synthase [(2E,6E)-farnesyldiphosphate specific] n=1 Tax=Cucurbita maxima TaxID=3661 RepID=A0A6J1L559_CUCMA|nr:dehydrodolichyl diphosphate synthase complex subunit nus1-like isoform X2 [Cucurbita maxima]